jgi:hypothetical protein
VEIPTTAPAAPTTTPTTDTDGESTVAVESTYVPTFTAGDILSDSPAISTSFPVYPLVLGIDAGGQTCMVRFVMQTEDLSGWYSISDPEEGPCDGIGTQFPFVIDHVNPDAVPAEDPSAVS